MLRPDGYVKVLDFGLAKLIEAPPASPDTQTETWQQLTTESGIVLGTASYLSPEQARGQKADARADIFLEVEKYLPSGAPGRAVLERLRPRMSDTLTVESEPPGASVYLKRSTRGATRQLIGATPISKLSIARGEYILAIKRDGFAPFGRTISGALSRVGNALLPPDEPSSFKVKLIEAARLPARMAFVPGGAYKLVSRARPCTATT